MNPPASPAPPGLPPDPTPPPPARPRIFSLFVVFAIASALFQFVIVLIGLFALWLSTNPFAGRNGIDIHGMAPVCFWGGLLLLIMGLPLMAAYAAAPFLPAKPWAWKFNLSLIGFGVVSPVFFLAIPVSRGWTEPDVQAWYGLPPTPPA